MLLIEGYTISQSYDVIEYLINFFKANNKKIAIALANENVVIKNINKVKEIILNAHFIFGAMGEYISLIKGLGGEIDDNYFEFSSQSLLKFLKENRIGKISLNVVITNREDFVNFMKINEENKIDTLIKYFVPFIATNEIIDTNGCGDCNIKS